MSDAAAYEHATKVAEAACRLQDAISAAEAAGLRIDVEANVIVTEHFASSDSAGYSQVRTTIDVVTSKFLSRGGK